MGEIRKFAAGNHCDGAEGTVQAQATGPTRGHHLVIIGNGFDLACGLRSSFSEFFSPRVQAIRSIEAENDERWAKALANGGFTAWDLIMLSRKDLADRGFDIAWCDVEAAIAAVVRTSEAPDGSSYGQVSISSIAKYFRFIRAFQTDIRPTKFVERFSDRVSDVSRQIQLGKDISRRVEGKQVNDWAVKAFEPYIVHELEQEFPSFPNDAYGYYEIVSRECPNLASEQLGIYLKYRYPTISEGLSVEDALMEELHRLEAAFGDYLSREVQDNSRYGERAACILSEICNDLGGDGGLEASVATTLLNFNYTNPIGYCYNRGHRVTDFHQVNVHGRLGSQLIFGIDGSVRLSDAGQVRFSKTFRVLQLETPSIQGSIAYPSNGRGVDLETTAIGFYGHSLSSADYSYFQSIFDAVDLYGGHVKLYFFYQLFKPNALDELLVNVANLLNEYGKSLDNKSHGRNLMHKLLLEGRLVVKEVTGTANLSV